MLDISPHVEEPRRMDDQALLSFGLWIKRRRKALDLTQDALAARIGCSKDLNVKIEGDARQPSREIAALLAAQIQLAPEERDDFIGCTRAELAPDRLPPTARSAPRAAFPARPSADRPRSNLPAPISAFLGREKELADLRALLARADVRLVTLTGPGGTGKTRLALAVAAELASPPSLRRLPLSRRDGRGGRGVRADSPTACSSSISRRSAIQSWLSQRSPKRSACSTPGACPSARG